MSFRDNLIHLRASRNMTQEQLAMLLGVSRQSVTKWESERSYPEMDKLLKMCQLFDCTLDDLVQGDLTDRQADPVTAVPPGTPPADVFGYDSQMRHFASRIANGVMAIILGVAVSLWFYNAAEPQGYTPVVLPENIGAALGVFCVLAGIAIGLSLIIPAAMARSQFVRSHPYIEDFYTEEQKSRARSTFSVELIGGICAIFLGVCISIVCADTDFEIAIGVPAMMICIAVGVRFIVHGSMTLSRTNLANYNLAAAEVMEASEIQQANIPPQQKQEVLEYQKQDKRIGAVCGTIMLIATMIALMLLFLPMANGDETPIKLFWLPWPIGGMLCGIAALLMKGFDSGE